MFFDAVGDCRQPRRTEVELGNVEDDGDALRAPHRDAIRRYVAASL